MTPRRLAGLALLIAATSVSAACSNDSDRFRTNLFVSPDGSLIADWWDESSGGALGSIADYVQIRPRSERFRFKDDIVFRGLAHGPLRLVWKSGTELEITYPKETTVFESKSIWNNVSITYRRDAELNEYHPDYSHFGGAYSPDVQNVAVWHQDPSRGDSHWLEDCVQLVPSKYDPSFKIGDNCSFVGITGDNLKMKWSTAKHLSVTYPPGTKVSRADSRWKDVTITYAEDPKLQKY